MPKRARSAKDLFSSRFSCSSPNRGDKFPDASDVRGVRCGRAGIGEAELVACQDLKGLLHPVTYSSPTPCDASGRASRLRSRTGSFERAQAGQ